MQTHNKPSCSPFAALLLQRQPSTEVQTATHLATEWTISLGQELTAWRLLSFLPVMNNKHGFSILTTSLFCNNLCLLWWKACAPVKQQSPSSNAYLRWLSGSKSKAIPVAQVKSYFHRKDVHTSTWKCWHNNPSSVIPKCPTGSPSTAQVAGYFLSTEVTLLFQPGVAGGFYPAAAPHGLGARTSRWFFQY